MEKKKNKNFIAEIVLVHEVKTAQIFLRIYKIRNILESSKYCRLIQMSFIFHNIWEE